MIIKTTVWVLAQRAICYSHTVVYYSNGSMADYWGGMPFCPSVRPSVCLRVCPLSPPTVFMVGQPFLVCRTCTPLGSSLDKRECKLYFILKVISQMVLIGSPRCVSAHFYLVARCRCHHLDLMYCIIGQASLPARCSCLYLIVDIILTQWCNVFDTGQATSSSFTTQLGDK